MTRIAALTDQDRQRVSEAVTAAEAHTAGEIVTIVTDRSDTYADFAMLWAALMAFLALLFLAIFPDVYLRTISRILGEWNIEWVPQLVLGLAATVAMLKFLGMWLLQLWEPLRLFLVPGRVKHHRVRLRAETCFKVGAERRTHGRTGILIYLSLAERRAEIVADQAIAGKVDPVVWGDAMAAMIAEIREGRIADGMIAAVERVGVVLAEHFPRADNDIKELPDRLIEV